MQSLLGILATASALIMVAACAGSIDSGAVAGSGGPGPGPGPGAGGGGSQGGGVCGGADGTVCATDQYCDFSDDTCGAYAATGLCKPRPGGCSKPEQPVCACDGQVYANACEANQAGVDVGGTTCAPPPGTFACGSGFCALGAQFCRTDPEPPPNYSASCVALPAACGTSPSCACLAGASCGNCFETAEGGLVVSCAAG
jgi:hypothetical protein